MDTSWQQSLVCMKMNAARPFWTLAGNFAKRAPVKRLPRRGGGRFPLFRGGGILRFFLSLSTAGSPQAFFSLCEEGGRDKIFAATHGRFSAFHAVPLWKYFKLFSSPKRKSMTSPIMPMTSSFMPLEEKRCNQYNYCTYMYQCNGTNLTDKICFAFVTVTK